MRILYLNGADNEGGAAKAATRLLRGVREAGEDARLHVQRRFGDFPGVTAPDTRCARVMGFARPSLEEAIFGSSPAKTSGPFCASFLPDGLLPRIGAFAPDLVHLHWVARMARLETLARIGRPLLWTMHDSWPFTGGCYLPLDCARYRESCGACPLLGSGRERDLSRRVWSRKERAWRGIDLTVIAPSRWMAQRARESSLFRERRVEVIPNGIDLRRYRPLDGRTAREILSLPLDRKLILFGAKGALSDRNKGFHLLARALGALSLGALAGKAELVVFGGAPPEQGEEPESGFRTHHLGWLGDEVSLSLLYAAADLFVLPSIQENLPFTVMEAMACGTPCIAFDQGGVPDLIDHGANGYLARPYEPDDLACGIEWALQDGERLATLSGAARGKVEREFGLERTVERHLALYRELLGRDPQDPARNWR